ncbi:MAG: membrane protein insertion efficiency factor YidD, partial [Chthoniobacterales bacterium]
MRALVRIFVRTYKVTLSPVLAFLGGPDSGCRFWPTCSEYLLEAVEQHGFWRGSWFGAKRLLRCQPWGESGRLVEAAGVTEGGAGSSSTQRDSAGLVRGLGTSAALARLRAGS